MADIENPGSLPTDAVNVRSLTVDDLDAIVRIDAAAVGRNRREYYRDRIAAAVGGSRIHTSLVAELEGSVVGFLLAIVHHGEFGRLEPTAVIDSLGVNPDFRGSRVGEALMRQFLMNTKALGVELVRTEVAWNDPTLIPFFDRHGFAPSARLVLEKPIGD